MNESTKGINPSADKGGGIWAPLTNITLAANALGRAMERPANLPGIVSLYGPSGYGKSMSAAYCCNRFAGVYIECRSFMTKKMFLRQLLKDIGVRPGRDILEDFELAAEALQSTRRPLIIDEVDHIVEKNVLEIVRDLHEATRSATLLIGEEQLPRKLLRWERFHNRMLVWQPAQAANLDDARKLARFYAPSLDIADDLIKCVLDRSRGVVRRICVNIDMIRDHASKTGAKRVDLAAWDGREFYTGDAPARRTA